MASIVDYLKSQGQDSSFSNRATLASQKGIKDYSGTATQNTQLLGLLSQPAPTTVSSASIQPNNQITIPQNNVSQMQPLPVVSPQETAVNNAMTQNSQVEQGYNQANSDLQTLSKQLESKGTDTLALEQQQGIPQISQQVLELQDLANQKALEANLTPYSLQGQGRGIPTGILRGQEAVKQRQLQVEGIFANAQLQAAQGKLQLAQSQVDRAINLKYEPILARIDTQKQIIENNKYLLSRSDQKLADAKSALLSQQKMEQEKKMEDEKTMQNMVINASSQGAPSDLVTKAQQAKSPMEAAKILGEYSGDFYKTSLLKAQIDTEKAQKAKYYADIDKIKSEMSTKGLPVTTANIAKVEASQSVYDIAQELLTAQGKGGAVGFGIKKSVIGSIPFVEGGAIAGTDRATYEAKFKQLKDTLASANLDKLKGAMSDKDIEFLRNIGTALSLDMPESAFDAELKKVQDTMVRVPGVQVKQPTQTVNKFNQAMGISGQSVPGMTIIKSIDNGGNINFTLP